MNKVVLMVNPFRQDFTLKVNDQRLENHSRLTALDYNVVTKHPDRVLQALSDELNDDFRIIILSTKTIRDYYFVAAKACEFCQECVCKEPFFRMEQHPAYNQLTYEDFYHYKKMFDKNRIDITEENLEEYKEDYLDYLSYKYDAGAAYICKAFTSISFNDAHVKILVKNLNCSFTDVFDNKFVNKCHPISFIGENSAEYSPYDDYLMTFEYKGDLRNAKAEFFDDESCISFYAENNENSLKKSISEAVLTYITYPEIYRNMADIETDNIIRCMFDMCPPHNYVKIKNDDGTGILMEGHAYEAEIRLWNKSMDDYIIEEDNYSASKDLNISGGCQRIILKNKYTGTPEYLLIVKDDALFFDIKKDATHISSKNPDGHINMQPSLYLLANNTGCSRIHIVDYETMFEIGGADFEIKLDYSIKNIDVRYNPIVTEGEIDSYRIEVFPQYANRDLLSVKCTNGNTVYIDGEHLVFEAVKPGKAVITLDYKTGSTNMEIEVKPIKRNYKMIPSREYFYTLGFKKSLSISGCTEDEVVTWKSTNESVATVTANGKVAIVESVGHGECDIECSVWGTDIVVKCHITVNNPETAEEPASVINKSSGNFFTKRIKSFTDKELQIKKIIDIAWIAITVFLVLLRGVTGIELVYMFYIFTGCFFIFILLSSYEKYDTILTRLLIIVGLNCLIFAILMINVSLFFAPAFIYIIMIIGKVASTPQNISDEERRKRQEDDEPFKELLQYYNEREKKRREQEDYDDWLKKIRRR